MKRIISLLCILILAVSLVPCAYGEEDAWESKFGELLEKYDVDEENISAGYVNLVTGEEHYFNPDAYFIAASMYKVPLNMLYADRIASGEMSADDDIWDVPYRTCLERTIIKSDNDLAAVLMDNLGGFHTFRYMAAPYFDVDPDNADQIYYVENYNTARQYINCLKLLYAESGKYSGIIENMKAAEPEQYFRRDENRYEIAQKYGFLETDEGTYLNDCALIFTDEPVAIVMFQRSVYHGYDIMADFCTLMCDYAESSAAPEPTPEPAAETEAVPEPVQTQTESVTAQTPAPEQKGFFDKMSVSTCITIGLVITTAILAAVLIFRRNMSGKINSFWAGLAIITAALAMILCAVGTSFGTVVAKPTGNPQDSVNAFFTAVKNGDYATAYSYLLDYSDLGLENEPQSEEGKLLYKALADSYDYTVHGEPAVDKLTATQTVAFKYLNLSALEEDAKGRIDRIISSEVDAMPKSSVYADDGTYLQSFTDAVHIKALKQALEKPDSYYTSSEFDVELSYVDGKWMIITNSEMLKAFLGGAA